MNVIALKTANVITKLELPAKLTVTRYLDMDKFVSLVVFSDGTSDCHMDFGTANLSKEETEQLADFLKQRDPLIAGLRHRDERAKSKSSSSSSK